MIALECEHICSNELLRIVSNKSPAVIQSLQQSASYQAVPVPNRLQRFKANWSWDQLAELFRDSWQWVPLNLVPWQVTISENLRSNQ